MFSRQMVKIRTNKTAAPSLPSQPSSGDSLNWRCFIFCLGCQYLAQVSCIHQAPFRPQRAVKKDFQSRKKKDTLIKDEFFFIFPVLVGIPYEKGKLLSKISKGTLMETLSFANYCSTKAIFIYFQSLNKGSTDKQNNISLQ